MLVAVDRYNNKIKIEDASINESYYCPECDEKLIVKKSGLKRKQHFAHKPNSVCVENKYDSMCEWHLNWQERFPEENREVVLINSSGKKHIADVLYNNIEIEFQHSGMPFERFEDRNDFYHQLGYRVIWIFDGNDVFKSGYNDGPFPFLSVFECLKKLKDIPDYLDVFIEGDVQFNLFTDSGLFLHHVKCIDEKVGIIFDSKYTIDQFMNNVINNRYFSLGLDNILHNEISIDQIQVTVEDSTKKKKLIEIINEHKDANQLIVYNTKTGYDYLINSFNIKRAKEGKFIKGKMKHHSVYGDFQNKELGEIYYIKEPIWIFQHEYK